MQPSLVVATVLTTASQTLCRHDYARSKPGTVCCCLAQHPPSLPPATPPPPNPRHCVQDRGLTGGGGQPEVRCWVIDGPARVNTWGSLSMLVRGLSASLPPPPPTHTHLFHPSPPSPLCRQPGGNGSSRKFGQIVPLFVAFCSILQHASYHKPFSKLCYSKHVSEIT